MSREHATHATLAAMQRLMEWARQKDIMERIQLPPSHAMALLFSQVTGECVPPTRQGVCDTGPQCEEA